MANQPDDEPVSPDDMLPPSEATDSDELRNDDGDESMTAPDHWRVADETELFGEAAEGESLDHKLAAEEPDAEYADTPQTLDEEVGVTRHRGQVAGSPEDGGSFFPEE
jgi:hypothetical protein